MLKEIKVNDLVKERKFNLSAKNYFDYNSRNAEIGLSLGQPKERVKKIQSHKVAAMVPPRAVVVPRSEDPVELENRQKHQEQITQLAKKNGENVTARMMTYRAVVGTVYTTNPI